MNKKITEESQVGLVPAVGFDSLSPTKVIQLNPVIFYQNKQSLTSPEKFRVTQQRADKTQQ